MSPSRRDYRAHAATDSPSTAEAAATQHTLNYALGNLGGRQKSWMAPNPNNQHAPNVSNVPSSYPNPNLHAVPATRKRGRPHIPTPEHQPQPPAVPTVTKRGQPWMAPRLQRPQADLGRDRHPPSNSTSPQLANIVSHSLDRSPLLSPNAVLPSPSPSEDRNVDYTRFATSSVLPETTIGAVASPVGISPSATVDEIHPAAASPKRPDKRVRLEEAQLQQGVPIHGQQEPRATATPPIAANRPTPPQVYASLTGQTQTRSPSLAQQALHNRVPSQPSSRNPSRPSSRTQSRPQGQPHDTGTPPQSQSPFSPPGVLSRGPVSLQHNILPMQQVASAQVQSPVQHQIPTEASPLAYPVHQYSSLQECQDALQRYQELNQNMLLPLDKRRLEVLKDAVAKFDWEYLTVHQYYCLLDLEPQSLPHALRNHPKLMFAFGMLQDVLETNSSLSPGVRSFFANFPKPLAQIAVNWPRSYEQQQAMVVHLITLSHNFLPLQQHCIQRRYPPLVQELVSILGITSPVLQMIVFMSTLRRNYSNAPRDKYEQQFEAKALEIFLGLQTEFMQRQSRRYSNASAERDNQEGSRDAVRWTTALGKLCATHDSMLLSRGWQLPHQVQVQRQQAQQQTRAQTHPQVQNNVSVPSLIGPTLATQIQLGRQVPRPVLPGARGRPDIVGRVSSQRSQQPPRVAASPRLPHQGALLPLPGWQQPQRRVPMPAHFSLQQANLRSPVLRAQSVGSVLYQYVQGWAKPPTRLKEAGQRVEKWKVTILAEGLRLMPKEVPGNSGQPPSRILNENSQMLRLRCIKWPSTGLADEHMWAVADTAWIPYAYFTFNGTSLHPRRKLQYGKDQPMDLTGHVMEGDNTLEIAVMRQANDETYLNYLVALEIIGVKSHEDIKRDCLEMNLIPAAQIKDSIRRKLSATDNDDDELAIVQSTLTITLFDPFSASQICDIPVRSRACVHYDCFDLETFLSTRKRKDDASAPDVWRCPICNADARPQWLVVDGFLQEVRQELEKQGLARTRAIVVDQDGTWKPKPEPRKQNSDTPDSREPSAAAAPSHQPAAPPAHAQVVDLSD